MERTCVFKRWNDHERGGFSKREVVRKVVETQPTTLVPQLAKTRTNTLEKSRSVETHRKQRQEEGDPFI